MSAALRGSWSQPPQQQPSEAGFASDYNFSDDSFASLAPPPPSSPSPEMFLANMDRPQSAIDFHHDTTAAASANGDVGMLEEESARRQKPLNC
ncbi:MAG: hypothetical protein WKF84_22610 [Pyrinomonadaceae bacterium]